MYHSALCIKIAFMGCFLMLVLTVMDRAMLHDIRNDYVSPIVLKDNGITVSKPLPSWTVASGEWLWVNINYALKVLLSLFILVLLSHSTKYFNAEEKRADRLYFLVKKAVLGAAGCVILSLIFFTAGTPPKFIFYGAFLGLMGGGLLGLLYGTSICLMRKSS